jgi:hypothetical protein
MLARSDFDDARPGLMNEILAYGLRRRKAHRPSNPSADRREFVGDTKDLVQCLDRTLHSLHLIRAKRHDGIGFLHAKLSLTRTVAW